MADVADRAPDLTTGQLRALLRKLCLVVDPEDAKTRLQRAVEDRRVVLEANPAGSANLLLLDLPPDVAAAARERIDHLARRLPGDDWTMDQRRADVASTCLSGTASRWVGGWSTSPWICAPCSGWPRTPVSWAGGDRWSPTSPARSPTAKETAAGRPPSSTTTATPSLSPYGVVPPPPRPGRCGPGTAPACSPDAGCPPDPPTSTTPDATSTADPPSNGTSHHCASSTTGPKTKAAGDTGADPTATMSGPARHGHPYVTSGRSP